MDPCDGMDAAAKAERETGPAAGVVPEYLQINFPNRAAAAEAREKELKLQLRRLPSGPSDERQAINSELFPIDTWLRGTVADDVGNAMQRAGTRAVVKRIEQFLEAVHG